MLLLPIINDLVDKEDLVRNNIQDWCLLEEIDYLGNQVMPAGASFLRVKYFDGSFETIKSRKHIIDFLSELNLSKFDEILNEWKI